MPRMAQWSPSAKHQLPIEMIQDVYSKMRQQEEKRPCPIAKGHYTTCYQAIASYTVELCDDLGLRTPTIFRAFSLMDRVFTFPALNTPGQESWFQLVVLACVSIATKSEGTPDEFPCVGSIFEVAAQLYSGEDFSKMERSVLNYLGWRINDVTASCFTFVLLGHCSLGHQNPGEQLERVCVALLGLTLQDPAFNRYPPSIVGATVLKLARGVVTQLGVPAFQGDWGPDLVALTQYTAEDLEPCFLQLKAAHLKFLSSRREEGPDASSALDA